MNSVRGQGCLAQRSQASEAPINQSNDEDHEDLPGSNESGPSKTLEAFIRSPEASLSTSLTLDIAQYI